MIQCCFIRPKERPYQTNNAYASLVQMCIRDRLSGGAVLILNNDAIDENDRPFWNLEFSQ